MSRKNDARDFLTDGFAEAILFFLLISYMGVFGLFRIRNLFFLTLVVAGAGATIFYFHTRTSGPSASTTPVVASAAASPQSSLCFKGPDGIKGNMISMDSQVFVLKDSGGKLHAYDRSSNVLSASCE